MKQVVEHEGVLLQVIYEIVQGEVVFDTVHLLDGSYLPVGPNLTPMLDAMFVCVSKQCVEGERFLSKIAGELYGDKAPASH